MVRVRAQSISRVIPDVPRARHSRAYAVAGVVMVVVFSVFMMLPILEQQFELELYNIVSAVLLFDTGFLFWRRGFRWHVRTELVRNPRRRSRSQSGSRSSSSPRARSVGRTLELAEHLGIPTHARSLRCPARCPDHGLANPVLVRACEWPPTWSFGEKGCGWLRLADRSGDRASPDGSDCGWLPPPFDMVLTSPRRCPKPFSNWSRSSSACFALVEQVGVGVLA